MPVRQRRQVCVSRREPARAWLLHAYSGHAGVLAASHQKRRRRWLARRGRSALAAEACDCELQNAQFVPQQQSARHPPGLSQNGALRRPHHMRPQLPDSGGCRSATNREQRCAALGAVALPAGTTVGQGHLARVGDGDLFAADASALWVGLRSLWVPCARFNHGQAAYSQPIGFPRALPINRGRTLRPEHPLARLVGGLGLVRGIVGQLS
jgi:hypothetical protein